MAATTANSLIVNVYADGMPALHIRIKLDYANITLSMQDFAVFCSFTEMNFADFRNSIKKDFADFRSFNKINFAVKK